MDTAICPKCGKAELERKFSKIVEETKYTMTVDELYICPKCGKEVRMKARHYFNA